MSLGRVAIVGAGAVGAYYGARLVEAGYDVTFLMRSDYDYVREHGLSIQSVDGDFSLPRVKVECDSARIGVVDLVVVAWKSTSNALSEEVISPLVGEGTRILTLQNGLGNAELLAGLFGADRVLAGLCFVCINRLRPGVISHTAAGLIRIGAYTESGKENLSQVVDAFQQARFPCEAVDSLEKALWMKLVWNVPFNGYAIAEGGVDTAVLLQELGLERDVRAVMQEVVSVAKALGHEIPQHFIDKQIEITIPMGGYRPSSMIDYVEGRPVEYEAIWGTPLRVARELGVEVPAMQELAKRIRERLGRA